ncbi:MAG: hypothetical protein K5888_08415 [Lachnospiraceae bacterium]|nr:hypothetical protein [Lachnospiraceae bacterium]
MKKTPLIFAVIATIIVFELLGIVGYNNIYATQDHDPVKEPILARVFSAINDGIYPWDMFNEEKKAGIVAEAGKIREKEEAMKLKASGEGADTASGKEGTDTAAANGNADTSAADGNADTSAADGNADTSSKTGEAGGNGTGVSLSSDPVTLEKISPTATPEPTPTPEPESIYPEGRLEPLRESTYDEYINHISADIYGDTGVLRAATYEFKKVGIDYFDDALFIGDSRTVGLRDYTELKDHADFLCETSLTISKVFTSDFKGKGTVEAALSKKDYGKIYIMVGVNELGTGTTEDFIEKYAEVVDRLHELEPDAKIVIQSIMNIDRERSTSDDIFNNTNILGRNNAIATLADNKVFFYININEAVCDEDGFLRDDLRGDHLHLLGASNEIVVEYLLDHGV